MEYTYPIAPGNVKEDLIIEFDVGGARAWYDLWDFSVYTAAGEYKTGRLHSQKWSFSAADGPNQLSTEFTMYPLLPSDLGGYYVKSVNLARIRPFGFYLTANAEGTTTGATLEERRRSKNTEDTYAEYAIFVNNPDIEIYPTTVVPEVSLRQEYSYCAPDGTRGNLTVLYETNSPGIASILVDLDGNPGYDDNSEDTLLIEEVPSPGTYEITWNGIDGQGNVVPSGTQIEFSIKFESSPLHVPLWDIEGNQFGGLEILDVRPNLSQDKIFWDDRAIFTNLADFPIPFELEGTNSNLHQWLNNSGNENLLNT